MLVSYASAAPNVRDFYVRMDDHPTEPGFQMSREKVASLEEFRLVSFFQRFGRKKPDDDSDDMALYLLLDHMTTIMRTSKDANDLLSARVSEIFTQMTVIGECIMQLSVFYDTPMGYITNQDASHSHDKDFLKCLYHIDYCQLPVQSVNPFRGKLAYPTHKPRSKVNTQAMRATEANLDRFWECVDIFFEKETGMSQHEAIRQCILEGREIQRRPPWVPLEDHQQPKQVEKLYYLYQPFSRVFHDRAVQITGVFDRLAVEDKIKPKTKGSTATDVIAEPVRNCVTSSGKNSTPKTFSLDKSAFKTVGSLFGEPHSDSDIPYITARRVGRRLERVYGWNSKIFRLA
ncbi:hypothetical protein TW65_06126 [Stemphylium lycopersici]|nr:hypothetical protein TW65_06126 [Stemphylium lycopersici]